MRHRALISLSLPAAGLAVAIPLACLLTLGVARSLSAQQPSYSVVYNFCQGGNYSDAQNPYGDLIADSAGNLYGTTEFGGTSGEGTVFEISAAGTETVLHNFAGYPTDGAGPLAGLALDTAGNLFGTTNGGGAVGLGTVFEVSVGGTETVLHSFTGASDEGLPAGKLLLDDEGNLYGTTDGVFSGQYGTVFKMTPAGKVTELHTFPGFSGDGENPDAGLTRDSVGNLYGTTFGGGARGFGTVFEVSKDETETVLYSFEAGDDGMRPAASLVRDAEGNLYSTTIGGGGAATESCDSVGTLGCGTVFKVPPDGQENVLYSFTGGTDGGVPRSDLLLDPKGNLYGTTSAGGSAGGECFGQSFTCGVVFEVSAAGRERVLHAFAGYPDDGGIPYGGLLRVGNYLYGTTNIGGAYDCGTVYQVTP